VQKVFTLSLCILSVAEVRIPFPNTQCCGGPHSLSDEEVSKKFVMMILQTAKRNGANIIATECPLCHASLEMYRYRLMLEGVRLLRG